MSSKESEWKTNVTFLVLIFIPFILLCWIFLFIGFRLNQVSILQNLKPYFKLVSTYINRSISYQMAGFPEKEMSKLYPSAWPMHNTSILKAITFGMFLNNYEPKFTTCLVTFRTSSPSPPATCILFLKIECY